MTHRLLALLACLSLAAPARADEAADKQTVAYLRKLQAPSGGFRTAAGDDVPTLRATSAAVRALAYLGGDVPDRAAPARFVQACFDAETGGFGDTPKGKADVYTTAVGVMAAVALEMPSDAYADPAAKFLSANAKGFEEIRIAAAGFEALKRKPANGDAWIAEIEKAANADGTFGKGDGLARATGGAVVALMRLGTVCKDRLVVLKALRANQRLNGGYGKDDSPVASDLETTYRVVRAFHMLQAPPGSIEGLRSFVAKCRNEDGGYAVAPGRPSSVAGTYYAATLLDWLGRPE